MVRRMGLPPLVVDDVEQNLLGDWVLDALAHTWVHGRVGTSSLTG